MHLHDPPLPPSQTTTQDIPTDLEAIVMLCLAKQPSKRPQSTSAMVASLKACRDYGRWDQEQARRWWSEYKRKLPMEERESIRYPLSDTHRLVIQ